MTLELVSDREREARWNLLRSRARARRRRETTRTGKNRQSAGIRNLAP